MNTKTEWNPDKPAIEEGMEYDGCPTVGAHAERGERMMEVHDGNDYYGPDETMQDYHVADAICDLLHFCDKMGYDGDAILQSGRGHWEAER